ncbi:MAG TPA: lysoplasmalogenase [Polyangia bacterium]|nr:lysoplasmalogenase [Polyangia bacterium]
MHLVIGALWVTSTLAIVGAEKRIRWMEVVFKPLTTLLFFAVIGRPETALARWVTAGIALSVIGDVALLGNGDRAFLIGLAAFLLAHVAYVIGFLGIAVWSPHVAVVALVMLASSGLLLRAIWKGAAAMHAATIAYAAVITVMVVAAWATVGGPLAMAPAAAVGSTLFYVSDATLALNRFSRPIPHIPLLAMGVYWLGQLGIAIAASGSF